MGRPGVIGRGGVSAGNPNGFAANSDARQNLTRLDAFMRQRGYSLVDGRALHAILPAGGAQAYQIQATPGCYVFVALAEANQNVDLVVLDYAGRTLGQNARLDGHPWVPVCLQYNSLLIARVQSAHAGGFLHARYQGPSQVDLSEFFNSGTTTPTVDAEVQTRVAQLDTRLGQDSYRRAENVAGFAFSPGETRDIPLRLQAGQCYAFGLLAGEGMENLQASLVNANHETLVPANGSTRDSVVRYCSTAAGSYAVRVAAVGETAGPVFLGAYVQQTRTGTGTGTTTNPPVENPPATGVIASESQVGENYRSVEADMRLRGYEPLGSERGESITAGQSIETRYELEGGKCYAIVAVGDENVTDLDLAVSRGSAELDRDLEPNNVRPISRVCATQSGTYVARITMERGRGQFLSGAFRWPRGTSGPFGLRGVAYVRVAEVSQLLSFEGYTPDPNHTPIQGTFSREGEHKTANIRMTQPGCYSFLAVGGEGIRDLDVALTADGTTLPDQTHNPFPNVRYCFEAAREVRLDVSSSTGVGSYYIQVFKKS